MDPFEKFLKNNKEVLDDDQINPEIWLSIENKMLKKRNKSMKIVMRRALSAAAILVLGFLAYQFLWNAQETPEDLLASYGIDHRSYASELEVKTQLIAAASIPISKKEDFDLLLGQLKFLDQQYEAYLESVKKNGYHEGLGKQIIDFYKTKIELLDKIQQEIETINYYEKKYKKASSTVGLEI